MCKINLKSGKKRIDPCLKPLLTWLKESSYYSYTTVASCCGHGKYSMSIVVKETKEGVIDYRELFTGKYIFRKKRFYKRDKEGYYYIPEAFYLLNYKSKFKEETDGKETKKKSLQA